MRKSSKYIRKTSKNEQHLVKSGVLKYDCIHDMNDNHERNDVEECEIWTFSLKNMRNIMAEIDLKRKIS